MGASAQDRPVKGSFREQRRRVWARLRGGELTPARTARSVSLGLFIGVLPLPGLHLLLVLAITLPLRLDATVAYLAANISIPPVAPFLWLAAIQLGSLVLSAKTVPLGLEGVRALMGHGPGTLLGSLALGSVLLGSFLAGVGGLITYVIAHEVTRHRSRRAIDPLTLAIARTAARYSPERKGSYYYVRGKLQGDPAMRAVAGLGPLGDVVDLGCGRGQLAILLLEAGAAASVRGYDWDKRKVELARRAALGLQAEFIQTDVRDLQIPTGDTVLLIDILHYFDCKTQDALLAHAAELVRPGGRLVIREADANRGFRSWATWIQENVGTIVRFNRAERVRFRDVKADLVPQLQANGFRCEVVPCWGKTPLSNVLLLAHRLPAVEPRERP